MGGAPSGAAAPTSTIAAPAQSRSGLAPPSALQPVNCPHCNELNPSDALFCEVCGYDFTTGQAPAPAVAVSPTTAQPVESAAGWLAVVEVDQGWYALKGTLADQPCPASSSSTIPLSNHTALIGRSSSSRGLHPEVALDADTGVSRRHAQFVRDGDSLTVLHWSRAFPPSCAMVIVSTSARGAGSPFVHAADRARGAHHGPAVIALQ
jgi:hypothetical protein